MPASSAREVFEVHMPRRFGDAPHLSDCVNGTYKFVLTGDQGGIWIVDMTRSPGVVKEEDADAECTVTVSSEEFVDIVNSGLNGQMAFLMGKLKVTGDLGLAMKLKTVLGD